MSGNSSVINSYKSAIWQMDCGNEIMVTPVSAARRNEIL